MAKTTREYDLTKGPILNKLLLVAGPIMGTQLLQMAYNLTDMFWLGRVGSAAVAASGTAGMYLWLSQAFMMVGRMGAEIGVAQSIGRGDAKTAREYSQTSLMLSVLLGGVFGLFMVVLRTPLIGFFGLEPAVTADAAVYLALTGVGVPFTYISATIMGTFNASGNSRTPFYINGVGLVLNMILDPLLITVLGWGIAGAAIATTFAQVVVAVIFLLAIKLDKNRPFDKYAFLTKYSARQVYQIARWSLPVVLESLLFTLLSMIISRRIVQFGTGAVATYRVGGQVESLSWLIGGGFASAVTAFVGQNYGARKWTRVRRGLSISTRVMLVWGVIVTLLLFFGGRGLYSIFIQEPEIIEEGARLLRILALCQIAGCLEYNSAGAFRGIGKTVPPSVVSIVGNVLRIPLIYYLSGRFGLVGIWWGVTIGAAVRSLWLFAWYLVMHSRLPKQDEPPPVLPKAT